jgi:RNA polymerase sigma-70 factor (ECF subfamily)
MYRKILQFALRHLDDHDLAEGIVVETMFEVWQNARKFCGGSSVSTWILGIARHKALDEVRRRKRHASSGESSIAEMPDETASALDTLVARETKARLDSCIKKLTSEQQECIHLVFYQELSLAEIAKLQGVPENTVKTRLFHARRKLKNWLGTRSELAAGIAW